MSIISHTTLPSFARLRSEGFDILTPNEAMHQDIREIHIGVLNMMPDGALQATERQLLRMIAMSNRIVQFHVHFFTLPDIERSDEVAAHIAQHYATITDLRAQGLDALIITGASPHQCLGDSFKQVIAWAYEEICSVLTSCFAMHAVAQSLYGIERSLLPEKRWGIYEHRVVDGSHPLVQNINTRFDAPHSRQYDISAQQFRAAGLRVLSESDEAGLYLGTSPDGLRFIFLQGHPEYELVSMIKEIKREVGMYFNGERPDYPTLPCNLCDVETTRMLAAYQEQVMRAGSAGRSQPPFPEEDILSRVDNTWVDTGKAIFNNWLGLVYHFTNYDNREKAFREDVNPNNPLNLEGLH